MGRIIYPCFMPCLWAASPLTLASACVGSHCLVAAGGRPQGALQQLELMTMDPTHVVYEISMTSLQCTLLLQIFCGIRRRIRHQVATAGRSVAGGEPSSSSLRAICIIAMLSTSLRLSLRVTAPCRQQCRRATTPWRTMVSFTLCGVSPCRCIQLPQQCASSFPAADTAATAVAACRHCLPPAAAGHCREQQLPRAAVQVRRRHP